MKETSYIYFIQAQADGPIKIGFTSDNPRKRLSKIQSDSPLPVTMLGAIEGPISKEKEFHSALREWRTRGEWFQPVPAVISFIQQAIQRGPAIVIESPQDSGADNPLKEWRGERSQAEAGKLLQVDMMTYSRWERGVHLPRKCNWPIIERVTGIKLEQLVKNLRECAQ